MKRIAVIFGGAGYIGGFLAQRLLEDDLFYKIWICDLKKSSITDPRICSKIVDVRSEIVLDLDEFDTGKSWVFHLAAVHREPGHEREEYFDTNLPGSENVDSFCERSGFRNLFFTSSIAPYGRSRHPRDESARLYAETAYGISKALAEKIHQVWVERQPERKLVIARPAVIYGPGDPGNVLRMVRAVRKKRFFYPGDPSIVKAYGYIHGFLDSILFTMKHPDRIILYNYAEHPLLELKEMVQTVRSTLGWKGWTPRVPLWGLVWIAGWIQFLSRMVGKKSDIHPARVRKAGFPTNIVPQWLLDQGFEFRWNFGKSLEHWKSLSPGDFE